MKILKVKSYSGHPSYHHVCLDEDGDEHRIDLLITGCLPVGISPKSLIGKEVKINKLIPYIEIAFGVEIIEKGAT